jgi:glyoxylase-like metal-dependent hydrolase (beta-lactamase superfamily II)
VRGRLRGGPGAWVAAGSRRLRGQAQHRAEVLLVPLTGHTRGHVRVAVETGGRWLLHAGDAYCDREQLWLTEHSSKLALALLGSTPLKKSPYRSNQQRLRELVARHGDAVTVFSSHDRHEFEQSRAQR